MPADALYRGAPSPCMGAPLSRTLAAAQRTEESGNGARATPMDGWARKSDKGILLTIPVHSSRMLVCKYTSFATSCECCSASFAGSQCRTKAVGSSITCVGTPDRGKRSRHSNHGGEATASHTDRCQGSARRGRVLPTGSCQQMQPIRCDGFFVTVMTCADFESLCG